MNLKQKIKQDLYSSLKEKKELELSTLRMLSAAIINKEKEKRFKLSKEKPELKEVELEKESQLNDEEITEVISSEIKKRKEAIIEYKKGNRLDLAEKEKKEKEVLEKYLPAQMSEEEIKKIVEKIITKVGASSIKDMGKVMKELSAVVRGKADMTLVSKIVRELL